MLPKLAHISAPEPVTDRRAAARRVVTFGFDAAEPDGTTRLLILNLSRTGLLLQTSAELTVGESIQIEVPEAGLVDARIVRRSEDRFGAMFDAPIPQAAVSAVLLASPAQPDPLDQAEVDAAHRAYPEYRPVPEALLWTVLTVTSLVAFLFVYALSFLPIIG